MVPVPILRRSKFGAPARGGAASCDANCSHSTLATLSINNYSVSSAGTPSSEACSTPPAISIGHLPFELLCGCLAGFSLDELLPLRLVSKTWFLAVNAQDRYSRRIYHQPLYMPSDKYDEWAELRDPEDARCRYSIDLLKARLSCSSRPISLRVVTSTLSEADTATVGSLISEHLHRIEFLFLELAPESDVSLFNGMRRPAPLLGVCILQVRASDSEGPASIPLDIFAGHAPLLELLSLTNAVFDPSSNWSCPAVSDLKILHLVLDSEECDGLGPMLAQCAKLESLTVEIEGWPEEPFLPEDVTPILGLSSLRPIVNGAPAAELDLLSALSAPTMPYVSMPVPRKDARHALLGQLRGLGPLTFRVYNDLLHSLGRTHIQLISTTTKRVRGLEANYDDHWFMGWSGVCLLDDFTACALTDDITVVHLTTRGWGYCVIQLASTVHGQWTAVHTVRIDVLGGRLVKPRPMRGEFPELVQVVLFEPALAPDAGESEVANMCTEFLLDFFAHSKTDTITVVLTRDEETADLVTADPSAAAGNPKCIVYQQSNPKIVPVVPVAPVE